MGENKGNRIAERSYLSQPVQELIVVVSSQEQMVLRHHNEAESLNAVQKMDWEWKLGELSGVAMAGENISLKVDDLYIPMVHVSDDFDLSDNR